MSIASRSGAGDSNILSCPRHLDLTPYRLSNVAFFSVSGR